MSNEAINELRATLQGDLVLPEDATYDECRAIWNAMIDKRPAIIVRSANAEDSVHALRYARTHRLDVAIRGAGHNIAGNAICEGGLVIDQSGMKQIDINTDTRRAIVGPGVTLGELDAATLAHGLATPVGVNSTTGIAGLTLGGGFGWLTRQYGMTVDNLVSAEVIRANGEKVHASEQENADLFWALRGGGGNFGIVTRFEFALHPVPAEILAGLLVFPMDQAQEILDQYRTFVASAPRELNVWVILRKAPPLPFLPEEVHGQDVVVMALCYTGDIAVGQALTAPLQHFGSPLGVHVGAMPFADWQQAFDPLLAPGSRNYWKSHNFTELSDGLLNTLIEYGHRLPSPQCEIFIALISGAANDVAPDAMAYGHRATHFVLNVHGRWDDPAQDGQCIDWARQLFQAAQPFASAGAYINFMTEDEGARVDAAFGPNLERLREVKRNYDPYNVFHMNQNIQPR
jgi:FAD/FMN-containing dehydrogenase